MINPETKENTEEKEDIRSRVPCLNNKIKPTLQFFGPRSISRQQQVDILFPRRWGLTEGIEHRRKKTFFLSSKFRQRDDSLHQQVLP